MQRVVAGQLRGRRLASLPKGVSTRPSSSRVRGAIFDRLQAEVVGAEVLDLFAGSGALAIEALSRGAAKATLVEVDRRVSRHLTEQLAALGLRERTQVFERDVLVFLREARAQAFGLVLIDPPYEQHELCGHVLDGLLAREWLRPDAVVVVESELHKGARRPIRVPPGYRVDASREHGGTLLEFLSLVPSGEDP